MQFITHSLGGSQFEDRREVISFVMFFLFYGNLGSLIEDK